MRTTQTEDAPHTFLSAASRAESQIIIQTNLQCVAHTCHLSSTQSIIGALLVSPGLFFLSFSTLIFEVSKSVRLTSLTEESTSFPATSPGSQFN